jgi:hypothetical protein
MTTNNKIHKKKVIETIIEMMGEIKPPIDLIVVQYHFNVLSSTFSEMNNSKIEEILNHFLNSFRKIFKKNEVKSLFISPELDWNNNGYYHQIVIRFCIIGNRVKRKRFDLYHEVKEICKEIFGGDFSLRTMVITELTDLLIELLPIPIEELDLTFKEFNLLNYFPEFYSKDLYTFMIDFYRSITQNDFESDKKIKL